MLFLPNNYSTFVGDDQDQGFSVCSGSAGTRIILEQAAPVRLLAASVSFRLSQVCSLNTLAAALLTLDSPILRPQPCLTVAK